MWEAFFRWLDDPFNALSFFTGAVVVCWWGTLVLRTRRAQLLRTTAAAPRKPRYRTAERAQLRGRPVLLAPHSATRPRAGVTPVAIPLSAPADTAVPLAAWWPQIVDSPVAVMIVGESQSGKSTTARALLAERARTDQIAILDPHEKFNDWGAFQESVIGRDRDLAAIVTAMADLHHEFERRFKRGEQVASGLTIFIDEVPAIIAAAPEVADYLAAWLLEGAKAQFRVVFLTQEPGVEALGLKGKGRVRLSTRKVLLGAYAAGVPGVRAWPAALEVRGSLTSIDATALPTLASRATAVDPAVAWHGSTEPVRDAADQAGMVTADRTSLARPRLVLPHADALRPGSPIVSDNDLIAELVRRGISANKIRDLLGGTKAVVLDKVRALRSQTL